MPDDYAYAPSAAAIDTPLRRLMLPLPHCATYITILRHYIRLLHCYTILYALILRHAATPLIATRLLAAAAVIDAAAAIGGKKSR